jgi:chromosome segregation ATPase
MTRILKGVIRGGVVLGVLTALSLGGMCLVAGKDATAIMLHDAQYTLRQMIDDNIDDPAVLRHQLMQLQEEYPERIAAVRKELAELNTQVRQLGREKEIAERVVALADEDLEVLEPFVSSLVDGMVMHQTAAYAVSAENGTTSAVRFHGRLLTAEQAAMRVQQIRQTQLAYENRAADAEHDLGYLQQQAAQFEAQLLKLETERSQFEAQLSQLDRQIDAIARNERLIQLMERSRKTMEECTRYEAQSLDHLHVRLDEIRSIQEAELDVLASAEAQVDYEQVARMQLEAERDALAPAIELLPNR